MGKNYETMNIIDKFTRIDDKLNDLIGLQTDTNILLNHIARKDFNNTITQPKIAIQQQRQSITELTRYYYDRENDIWFGVENERSFSSSGTVTANKNYPWDDTASGVIFLKRDLALAGVSNFITQPIALTSFYQTVSNQKTDGTALETSGVAGMHIYQTGKAQEPIVGINIEVAGVRHRIPITAPINSVYYREFDPPILVITGNDLVFGTVNASTNLGGRLIWGITWHELRKLSDYDIKKYKLKK